LHWMKQHLLKVVVMSAEAGIWHQIMGPLCKELLWLVLQSMHHYPLDPLIKICSSSVFSCRGKIQGSQMVRGPSCVDVGPTPSCLQSVAVWHVTKHYITQYMYIYFLITTCTY
jgi:hypothetical protein